MSTIRTSCSILLVLAACVSTAQPMASDTSLSEGDAQAREARVAIAVTAVVGLAMFYVLGARGVSSDDCDPHATRTGSSCTCLPGYQGDGTSCFADP